MPISTPYTIAQSVFFAVISCHRKCLESPVRYVVTVAGSYTLRPTSRIKWLGRVERDAGASSERPSAVSPLHTSFPLLLYPFRLPTSSGEIETSLLPYASRRSPPEPLFTNHQSGGNILGTCICTYADVLTFVLMLVWYERN